MCVCVSVSVCVCVSVSVFSRVVTVVFMGLLDVAL